MKNIKQILVAIVLFTTGFVSQAQVAHINSEELVAAMPETKAMQDQMKVLGQSYDTEYKAQAQALQAKLQKYQTEAATKTNEENEKRQQEVAEIQQKLQLYLKSAQEELQKKEFDLLKPIIEKAQTAIQDVAREKGIKYVLDSAPGKGLIVFEGEDLLPAVKAKLGM
jgi:outer membrane protein